MVLTITCNSAGDRHNGRSIGVVWSKRWSLLLTVDDHDNGAHYGNPLDGLAFGDTKYYFMRHGICTGFIYSVITVTGP